MKPIVYNTKAEEFLKKAEAEINSEHCLPKVAADYYNKAALFFVMDKNLDMAAKQYASAAICVMEDGEVIQSIEYLIKAGDNYPDKSHTHAIPYYEQASKYALDARQYGLAATCQKNMAEIWEWVNDDVKAAEHFRIASLCYHRAEMPSNMTKMEEKYMSLMSKVASLNKGSH